MNVSGFQMVEFHIPTVFKKTCPVYGSSLFMDNCLYGHLQLFDADFSIFLVLVFIFIQTHFWLLNKQHTVGIQIMDNIVFCLMVDLNPVIAGF